MKAYIEQHQAAFPPETVLAILKPTFQALDYAHGEGVIHRDLKPANLMIEQHDGRVLVHILDFGIAIIDELDHERNPTAQFADPLGTLLYMAPEQLRGELLTPACDLYALGLVAWELLMGRSAFEGKTRSQMMFFVLDGAPGILPRRGLAALVEKCTLPEPGSRPTARECIAMLEEPAT